MVTMTVWLLVTLGYTGGHHSSMHYVTERFATEAECVQVAEVLMAPQQKESATRSRVQCIQAIILVPCSSAPAKQALPKATPTV